MPYIFGVDGGGSNSRALLVTDQGRVVFCGKGGGVNPHEVGAAQTVNTIEKLFNAALQEARARKEECIGIGMGLAGAGREKDKATLAPLFDNLFGKIPYVLTTDADIALTSGTLSDTGVLVLIGTGSMVYGRNDEQETARAGGYGPLVSDDGSGYWLAVEGLRAIVRAHDGIDPPTMLTERFLEALKLNTVEELISWTNSLDASRREIAALAPLVIRAAGEDDAAADDIMNRGADALALAVEQVHASLQLSDRFDLVMAGGLVSHMTDYFQLIRRKILYINPGATVGLPKLEPVFGALLYGYSLTSVSIEHDLLDTIQSSYAEYQKRASSKVDDTMSSALENDTEPTEPTG